MSVPLSEGARRCLHARDELLRSSTAYRSGALPRRFLQYHLNDTARAIYTAAMWGANGIDGLPHELVWISSDMMRLIEHASQTLPLYKWTPDVLPWPAATCVAESPFVSAPHTERPDGLPLSVVQWTNVEDRCIVAAWHMDAADGYAMPAVMASLSPGRDWAMDGASLPETMKGFDAVSLERTFCTLWLMLRQKVAVRTTIQADRATRRQHERRAGVEPPTITVIELRRPLNTGAASGEAGHVDWSHRWMVGGHWRNQYHPSDKSRVPTWIAPYVKGPEDKPFQPKDKVYAWVR